LFFFIIVSTIDATFHNKLSSCKWSCGKNIFFFRDHQQIQILIKVFTIWKNLEKPGIFERFFSFENQNFINQGNFKNFTSVFFLNILFSLIIFFLIMQNVHNGLATSMAYTFAYIYVLSYVSREFLLKQNQYKTYSIEENIVHYIH